MPIDPDQKKNLKGSAKKNSGTANGEWGKLLEAMLKEWFASLPRGSGPGQASAGLWVPSGSGQGRFVTSPSQLGGNGYGNVPANVGANPTNTQKPGNGIPSQGGLFWQGGKASTTHPAPAPPNTQPQGGEQPGYFWGDGQWTPYAPPAQGQMSATNKRLQAIFEQRKAAGGSSSAAPKDWVNWDNARQYGLSDLNLELGGGSYNKYGQPLGTEAPLQTTMKNTRGGKFTKKKELMAYGWTPEEGGVTKDQAWERRNRSKGKLGPQIKDIIDRNRKASKAAAGGGSGGGGKKKNDTGQKYFYGNELITWKI